MSEEKSYGIKAGDTVIVCNTLHGRSIDKVEKITPSGFIKVNGKLYNKDGLCRGTHSSYIEVASEEKIVEVEQECFVRNTLRRLNSLKSLTYGQAVKIDKIL